MAERMMNVVLRGGPSEGLTMEVPATVIRIRIPRVTAAEQQERRELLARGLDDMPYKKRPHFDEYVSRIRFWEDEPARCVEFFRHTDWKRWIRVWDAANEAHRAALLEACALPEPLDPKLLDDPPEPEWRCCNGTCDRWREAPDSGSATDC